MVNCPECDSEAEEAIGSPDEKTDGQGYWWKLTYSYECNECGCIFNTIETTEKSIEIEKHGKRFFLGELNLKIDENKLMLSAGTYRRFQDVFTTLYKAFSKGKKKIVIRHDWVNDSETEAKRIEESAGLYVESYFHVRRVLLNLNFQGLAVVYKRKPPRPPHRPKSERVYSYLEVHPTDDGFKAYNEGEYCKVEGEGANEIRIGKGFVGLDHLKEKYFTPHREKYNIAKTRWENWEKEFRTLFETKLVALEEEEAKKEIEELVELLIPTLPKGRNWRVKEELKKATSLQQFIS